MEDFLCLLHCLCVGGFICDAYFAIICSSSLLLLVPRKDLLRICGMFWVYSHSFTVLCTLLAAFGVECC